MPNILLVAISELFLSLWNPHRGANSIIYLSVTILYLREPYYIICSSVYIMYTLSYCKRESGFTYISSKLSLGVSYT